MKPPTEAQIYTGTCLPNGKIYVGSTVQGYLRIDGHKRALPLGRHKNRYLQSAYNKYGPDAFEWKIVDTCDPKDRKRVEQAWIKKLRSNDPRYGFNIVFPVRDIVPSELMSAILKETWTPERRKKFSEDVRKQWDDPKLRAQRLSGILKTGKEYAFTSEKMRERWEDPVFREKFLVGLAKAVEKTAKNEEKHARASVRLKNKHQDPEFHAARLEALEKGRTTNSWTPERRAKAAERARARMLAMWDNPVYRVKRMMAASSQWNDPEVRAKMEAGMAKPEAKQKMLDASSRANAKRKAEAEARKKK